MATGMVEAFSIAGGGVEGRSGPTAAVVATVELTALFVATMDVLLALPNGALLSFAR